MAKKKIIFLHPDLGVGGAERLVVDAAIALKDNGFDVSFVTSYHSNDHCFQETKDGNLNVTVVGEWIPRQVFGRFFALLAYIKMLYCAFYIILFQNPDLVFCDLVSVCIPILHLSVKKVVYYCHYPDQLLSKQEGLLKRLYRAPLNWLEEKTTNCADKIYVNSEFTKCVYRTTFQSSSRIPTVLHPTIHTPAFDRVGDSQDPFPEKLSQGQFVFLSLNRYERKKRVELSIGALSLLKNKIQPHDWNHIVLVIAGGYDTRVKENVEYFHELSLLVKQHELEDKVLFFKSPSDVEKVLLLRRCNTLIYTPPNEHFGIVPLEAMYSKKPVIACNSGGPTETVVHGETGFLCSSKAEAFSDAMLKFINDEFLERTMGNNGYKRFLEKFSFDSFSRRLSNDVKMLLEDDKN